MERNSAEELLKQCWLDKKVIVQSDSVVLVQLFSDIARYKHNLWLRSIILKTNAGS